MKLRIAACVLLLAANVHAAHRRALLVGINDYTASHLAARTNLSPPPDRDWPNLSGAVNDVHAIEAMLVAAYGFDRSDIVTLTDQAATRAAILQTMDAHLLTAAAKDDVVLFYFAGHGSQVKNSLSDEHDKLDESIVPADSRAGAPDIRDKELRRLFNRLLDRGSRLTVILDNCHSGSGARGLATGARPRGINPDLRDVADRADGQHPEDRGALVLAAAQDFDTAWETRESDGTFHGAFSWALLRAMREASAGEPAMQTFLRVQARLRAETPFQEPVIAGTAGARRTPLLGTRIDRRDDRVVAVEKVKSDGTVVLRGGWANGLSVGSELRVADAAAAPRLNVTALHGLAESEARLEARGALPAAIHSGALLEVAGWAVPPDQPLRVWMPGVTASMKEIAALARLLAAEAAQRGVRWVSDPIDVTWTHLLRHGARGWELLGADGREEPLGSDDAAAAAVAKMPTGSSLFVQFPAPAALIEAIGSDGVKVVEHAEEADYILVGRFSGRRLSYAWMRPSVKKTDRRKTGLPLRTAWVAEHKYDDALRTAAPALRELLLGLRKIHAWHQIESPPQARFPYRLALRRTRDAELAKDAGVIGDERYELVLESTSMPPPARVTPRYVYAFVIDSNGKSTLLFPPDATGSVENRFPLAAVPPSEEIALGEASAFEIAPPYGVDTYFLLSADEPLPNPWILEWDSVRSPLIQPLTPLERLLMLTSSGARGRPLLVPSSWSIEKVVYESLPPRATDSRR